MGRYRVATELDAVTPDDIDELRRSRGLTRERLKQFLAGPYGAYAPPPDWNLFLRETQIFAVIAAEGTVAASRIIEVVYASSTESAPKEGSVRFQMGGLRRKLEPHGIVIRTTKDGWKFDDSGKVYELAQLSGAPPAPFQRKVELQALVAKPSVESADTPQEELAYTVVEAAKKLRVSRAFLYVEMRKGALKARKFGGRTLVLHSDLMAYVNGSPLAF